MEIGNFEDLVLFLNHDLKLKFGRRTPDSCPASWGALLGAINCLVVFQTPFNPSLNFLKFHLNSGRPPPKVLYV